MDSALVCNGQEGVMQHARTHCKEWIWEVVCFFQKRARPSVATNINHSALAVGLPWDVRHLVAVSICTCGEWRKGQGAYYAFWKCQNLSLWMPKKLVAMQEKRQEDWNFQFSWRPLCHYKVNKKRTESELKNYSELNGTCTESHKFIGHEFSLPYQTSLLLPKWIGTNEPDSDLSMISAFIVKNFQEAKTLHNEWI